MAITLNLLPQDKIVSRDLAKFLKISRVLGVISIFAFIVYSAVIGVLIYLNAGKVGQLEVSNGELKNKVAQLESSESQIVLIKDRIKKIETVRLIPSSLGNLTAAISLLSGLSDRAKVTGLDVDSKKVDLSINFKSNFEMNSFIDTVKNSKSFKSVVVSSYSLNPVSGYLISFNLVNQGK